MNAKLTITDANGRVFEGTVQLSLISSSKRRPSGARTKPTDADEYGGLKGGLRKLLSRSFFGSQRKLAHVREALAKDGYHYSASAVQTALNRMSGRSGPLVASRVDGMKAYVRRK